MIVASLDTVNAHPQKLRVHAVWIGSPSLPSSSQQGLQFIRSHFAASSEPPPAEPANRKRVVELWLWYFPAAGDSTVLQTRQERRHQQRRACPSGKASACDPPGWTTRGLDDLIDGWAAEDSRQGGQLSRSLQPFDLDTIRNVLRFQISNRGWSAAKDLLSVLILYSFGGLFLDTTFEGLPANFSSTLSESDRETLRAMKKEATSEMSSSWKRDLFPSPGGGNGGGVAEFRFPGYVSRDGGSATPLPRFATADDFDDWALFAARPGIRVVGDFLRAMLARYAWLLELDLRHAGNNQQRNVDTGGNNDDDDDDELAYDQLCDQRVCPALPCRKLVPLTRAFHRRPGTPATIYNAGPNLCRMVRDSTRNELLSGLTMQALLDAMALEYERRSPLRRKVARGGGRSWRDAARRDAAIPLSFWRAFIWPVVSIPHQSDRAAIPSLGMVKIFKESWTTGAAENRTILGEQCPVAMQGSTADRVRKVVAERSV